MKNTFRFGRNWLRYIKKIDEEKIQQAKKSLLDSLGSIKNKKFLDAGCGSGVFSLAAWMLGADVTSFDVDEESVLCTKTLHKKYGSPENWKVFKGSILDNSFMEALGKFEVVYSWGVVHHTGNMWKALENLIERLEDGGIIYTSIYNRHPTSPLWKIEKWIYNKLPYTLKKIADFSYIAAYTTFKLLKHENPFESIKNYRLKNRGMDFFVDVSDWLGGYPYEYAYPKDVINFFLKKNMELVSIKKTNSLGCNEYIFRLKNI